MNPIQAPGGFVPQHAVTFARSDGTAIIVDTAHPLPVSHGAAAAASTPLTGSTSSAGTFGPFVPDPARIIWLTLLGNWSGTVQLLRSRDGGATKLALSYSDGSPKGPYTVNFNAPVAEETVIGTSYFLEIALTSGTITYLLEQ